MMICTSIRNAAGFFLLLSVCSVARGEITAFWVPIASGDGTVGSVYPAAAIADDPQLAGMQTWDLMVTTSGDWLSAGLGAFSQGSVPWYHHPMGGNTRPNPGLEAAHPAIVYDTYVTAPGDNGVTGAPSLLGEWPGLGPVPSFGEHGFFSVAWGSSVVDAPGTYQIVRWTFSTGLPPRPILPVLGFTEQFDPDTFTAIPQIPEPASLLTLSVAVLIVSAVRARSAPAARSDSQ